MNEPKPVTSDQRTAARPVFVSYATSDRKQALAVCKALERRGAKCWISCRDVAPGGNYQEEIVRAIRDARAMVLVFSDAANNSDEIKKELSLASRHRVPLMALRIEDVEPSDAFAYEFSTRQWIDAFEGWDKSVDTLVRRLGQISGDGGPSAASRESLHRPRRAWILPKRTAAAVASLLVAAALLFAGWSYFSPRTASAETPTVAVLPFADLSPAGDKAYFAEGVAESILSLLGREPGIRVIGRTSASRFKSGATDLATIRNALGVTHVLEGSARTSGDDLRMSVRLVNASDGTQIWAEDYQRKVSNVFAVQDEIGRAVASRLVGTLSSPGLDHTQITKADAYDLYLAARAKMRDRKEPELREALALARRVLTADPTYAPGHALYAESIWHLSDAPFSYGSIPQERAYAAALAHARKAIALAPDSPDGYAALGLIAPDDEAVDPLKKAIRLDPARSELRVWLAFAYEALGRNEEAFRELQAAAAIDPLWTVAINRLTHMLAANGRFDEAEGVVQAYLARGGEPALAARLRSATALLSGDLSQAVRLARTAITLEPDLPYVRSYLEGYAAILGLPQLIGWEPDRNRLFSWLRAKGRDDQLLSEARRAGAALWARPDASMATMALAETRKWQQLEAIYDAAGMTPAGFCRHWLHVHRLALDSVVLPVAQALHHRGRTQEAATLLRCAHQQTAAHAGERMRSPSMNRLRLAFTRAQVLALSGRREAALSALGEAVQVGWRGYPYSAKLASYPALDALRSAAKYSEIQRRLDQAIAAERQQVLRDLNSRKAS